MTSIARREKKRNHDKIKEINLRISKGQPTTFQERIMAKIYRKRLDAKKKGFLSQ
jgi:hypothetical protein